MNALHAARISAESYISFRHNKGVNTKILTVPEILGLTERKDRRGRRYVSSII